MSLQDLITEKITKLNNNDSLWVTFIHDHAQVIADKADVIEITDADRDRYRHKLDHFIRDNGVNLNIKWILMMINELNVYDDFTLRNYLLKPDISQIMTLHRQYRTSNNISS